MTDAPEISAEQVRLAAEATPGAAEVSSATPATEARRATVVPGPGRQTGRDYEVGYGRPPKARQFKPGDRGNPNGRPRGSLNKTTIIEKALSQKIPVRRGDKTVKRPALQVIAETFALKAAEGDCRALMAMISLASKSGTWRPESNGAAVSPAAEPAARAPEARPSDRWVETLDDSRLSDEEKIALSILAEKIDSGGDVTALSGEDFALLKQIVSKGRGQSEAPATDISLDQAA